MQQPEHQYQPTVRELESESKSESEREGEVSSVRISLRLTDAAEAPDPPPAPPPITLSEAALAAERTAAPGTNLAALWQGLLDGHLVVCAEGASPRGRYAVVLDTTGVVDQSVPLKRIETAILVRVLQGEQQKLVASELGIACSTASKWNGEALKKLRLVGRPMPLPLVLAAQAWASGTRPAIDARGASFRHGGRS
jgi:hypothetical protein